MVKDIRSGFGTNFAHFTAVGNTLYFQANDGTNGAELWKSDGTASGTVMVKDINSGSGTIDSERFTLPLHSSLETPSISQPPTEPTESNCGRAMELPSRHGDGQEHRRQRKHQFQRNESLSTTSQPLETPSISERATEPTENRIVEERWNCFRHGDG